MKRLETDKGFTLLELMIALFLLLIGFLAVFTVHWTSVKGGSFSRKMTTAAALSQQAMEQLGSQKFSDLVAHSYADYTDANIAATGFTRQVQISDDNANQKTISVKITWNEGGTTKTRIFQMVKRPDY